MARVLAATAIVGGSLPGAFVSVVFDDVVHDCTYAAQKLSIFSVHPVSALWVIFSLHWLPSSAPLRDSAFVFVHDCSSSSGLPRRPLCCHIYIFAFLSDFPSLTPPLSPLDRDAQNVPTAPPAA